MPKSRPLLDRFLIVDCGGTTTHVFNFDRYASCVTARYTYLTKDLQLVPFLAHLANQSPFFSSRILGIPGDVCNPDSSGFVYCPPLGLSIHLPTMTSLGWMVVNDTIAHAFFSLRPSHYSHETPHSLVTIGTSFGFCSISPRDLLYPCFDRARSFEYAHLALHSLPGYIFEPISHYHSSLTYVHELYSMSGLARLFDLPVISVENSLISTASSSHIARLLLHPNSQAILETWLISLCRLIHELNRRSSSPASTVLLSGGLISMLDACPLSKTLLSNTLSVHPNLVVRTLTSDN